MKADLVDIRENWMNLEFPKTLGTGSDYAGKLHSRKFDYFLDRLRRLTPGGGVALDAGCGTATWSFPMAELFDRVIAVDRTRSRVDMGRWLQRRSGCDRVSVSYGDVTDLDVPAGSVDFVFCYSVIISMLSLRQVMREFRRVLKTGGTAYVCLNTPAWSRYLRDERGKTSATTKVTGIRGLYNTIVSVRHPSCPELLSRLVVRYTLDPTFRATAAQKLGLAAEQLDEMFTDLTAEKAPARIRHLMRDGAPAAARIAAVLDAFVAASGIPYDTFTGSIEDIRRDCGEEYVTQFGTDLLDLLSNRKDTFTHHRAGRGYTPEEVERVLGQVGFGDFRWAAEGKLLAPDGADAKVVPMMQAEFNGEMCVWEFICRKL
jgi:SAM-dependent methyltransferase